MLASDRVPVLDSDDSAEDALSELIGGEIHRGLVLHDGRLVGFVSISDLAPRPLSARLLQALSGRSRHRADEPVNVSP